MEGRISDKYRENEAKTMTKPLLIVGEQVCTGKESSLLHGLVVNCIYRVIVL